MKNRIALPILALAGLSVSASAQIIIDGSLDAGYGSAVVVQNTETQFGDSNLGLIDFANGSELDGAFATIRDGKLYLFLSGNLESNYNKLEVFIDCKPGGQNLLLNNNPDVDFNGLNRMAGLRFDTGFDADYWISVTGGGVPYTMYANYAELLTTGGGQGYYMGSTGAGSDGTLTGGNNNPYGIKVTINNSNTGGVFGGTGTGSGAGVSTGVEYCIPLAALGGPIGDFKICAFVNGGGHDYMSNQILSGMSGGGNLGDPSFVDFNNVFGIQDFTVSMGAYSAVSSVTLLEGEAGSGDLNSLQASDDDSYCSFNDSATLRCVVQFGGSVASVPANSLTFAAEMSTGRLGLQYQIKFRNANNNFVTVNGGVSSSTDLTAYATSNTPATFVGSGNSVAAQIVWSPVNDEAPAFDGWLHCVDKAAWLSN